MIKYSKKGVDYNDLLLIATASVNNRPLPLIPTASVDKYDVMTNEAIQEEEPKNKANHKIPKNKANYRIPLVCRTIIRPKIPTYSFIEWLKDQDPTF